MVLLPLLNTSLVYKVVTRLTRLETRTKESNMLASDWVCETQTRNESELLYMNWQNYAGRQCNVVPSRWLAMRWTQSSHVGTRKMVNYA